jgi:hypothetical protein
MDVVGIRLLCGFFDGVLWLADMSWLDPSAEGNFCRWKRSPEQYNGFINLGSSQVDIML